MNNISKQILRSDQFFPKLLICMVLVFSMVGIPFFIGYLARYCRQIVEKQDYTLPQWNQWLAMIIECWELLILFIVYALLPMSICLLVTNKIDDWFGIFGFIVWIPNMLIFYFAPILVCLSYCQYLRTNQFQSVLDLKSIYRMFIQSIDTLVPATFILWGYWYIGFPVFGFTIASGLILYFAVILVTAEENRYS